MFLHLPNYQRRESEQKAKSRQDHERRSNGKSCPTPRLHKPLRSKDRKVNRKRLNRKRWSVPSLEGSEGSKKPDVEVARLSLRLFKSNELFTRPRFDEHHMPVCSRKNSRVSSKPVNVAAAAGIARSTGRLVSHWFLDDRCDLRTAWCDTPHKPATVRCISPKNSEGTGICLHATLSNNGS